jgi:hypothetical protein
VKAPTSAELTRLAHTIARRVGRFLERQGLLERDAENSYLATDSVEDDPMTPLLGHSITYRIAVGPQARREVFTLQTLPASDEPGDGGAVKVIACIEAPVVIKQILDHLKHKAETSESRALPESRAPPAGLHQGLFD